MGFPRQCDKIWYGCEYIHTVRNTIRRPRGYAANTLTASVNLMGCMLLPASSGAAAVVQQAARPPQIVSRCTLSLLALRMGSGTWNAPDRNLHRPGSSSLLATGLGIQREFQAFPAVTAAAIGPRSLGRTMTQLRAGIAPPRSSPLLACPACPAGSPGPTGPISTWPVFAEVGLAHESVTCPWHVCTLWPPSPSCLCAACLSC